MANYGMKISKDGGDVNTADDTDLVMTSKFNQFKISAQGTFTVTVPANTAYGATNIVHGLGYAPGFMIYLEEVADSGERFPIYNSRSLRALSDTTKVQVQVVYSLFGTFGTNKTHDGYYFIYADEL